MEASSPGKWLSRRQLEMWTFCPYIVVSISMVKEKQGIEVDIVKGSTAGSEIDAGR